MVRHQAAQASLVSRLQQFISGPFLCQARPWEAR